MSEQVLNDQALLEMADQLKITLENLELKKHLISAYGFIRVLDMMATNSYDIQPEILILIETLRAYLSDYMDDNIFNITLQN